MSGPRAPILLAWSSGKDSAWSLHVLRQDPSLEVVGGEVVRRDGFVFADLLPVEAAA